MIWAKLGVAIIIDYKLLFGVIESFDHNNMKPGAARNQWNILIFEIKALVKRNHWSPLSQLFFNLLECWIFFHGGIKRAFFLNDRNGARRV